jgi:hypothetical protein
MNDVFNIFNSILKTKLKKSDRFSNFRFTNSQMFGDGLGVSLAYSDGKGTVTVNLYDNKNKRIPNCLTNKKNIESEIILEEFDNNLYGVENFLSTRNADILHFEEPAIIEWDLPWDLPTISTSFLYAVNDEINLAQLYLTSINNNFIKFRVTYQPSLSESDREKENLLKEMDLVIRLVENFIEDFVNLILIANSTKKKPTKKEKKPTPKKKKSTPKKKKPTKSEIDASETKRLKQELEKNVEIAKQKRKRYGPTPTKKNTSQKVWLFVIVCVAFFILI